MADLKHYKAKTTEWNLTNKWQVFVCVDSSEGGAIVSCQPYEPTGFWIDISPYDAAKAISNVEWVRLVKGSHDI